MIPGRDMTAQIMTLDSLNQSDRVQNCCIIVFHILTYLSAYVEADNTAYLVLYSGCLQTIPMSDVVLLYSRHNKMQFLAGTRTCKALQASLSCIGS